jgi:hypothetical protein
MQRRDFSNFTHSIESLFKSLAVLASMAMSVPPKTCPGCGCEDFLRVRSEVLADRPVTLVQCEDCGAQYSTGVLPWLPLPVIDLRESAP